MLLLLRAGPSKVRVIPPSRVVSIAGEVIIVLLWLILLLRLRRSIVNICSNKLQAAQLLQVAAWKGKGLYGGQ